MEQEEHLMGGKGEHMKRPNYERYWRLRNAGLCVSCGKVKTDKSRCPDCMRYQAAASANSLRNRLDRLEARIKELEGTT